MLGPPGAATAAAASTEQPARRRGAEGIRAFFGAAAGRSGPDLESFVTGGLLIGVEPLRTAHARGLLDKRAATVEAIGDRSARFVRHVGGERSGAAGVVGVCAGQAQLSQGLGLVVRCPAFFCICIFVV